MNKVGQLSDGARKSLVTYLDGKVWSRSKGEIRDYWAIVDGPIMFVKIEPGGKVHRHKDAGIKTHIVLQSQDAESWVGGIRYQLEEGGIYEFDSGLEHESFNHGAVDRIHMIIS